MFLKATGLAEMAILFGHESLSPRGVVVNYVRTRMVLMAGYYRSEFILSKLLGSS